MSGENRKVVIPVEVDSTGAKAGFDDVKQGARDMAQVVGQAGAQAGQGLKGVGDGAAPAAAKLDAATRSMIGSIQRTTAVMEAGERGSRKFFEALAVQRGQNLDVLRPYLDQLDAARAKQAQATAGVIAGTAALNAQGISAKQTTAALRQVPAQFTDIVTSLASGQRPIQVLLQQGGQLKDVFGGIGPAARALGGYIAGLINPVTLGAAAIGGLAFAAHSGSEELRAFQNAATLTGDALGVTSSRFAELRDSISGIAGTKGKAAEALTAIAQSGLLAGDNIRGIAEAAILMEKATGQSIEKTIDQFKELQRSPADAARKLNEEFNFLTAAVYAQIKALEESGNKMKAAEVAMRALADTTKERASVVVENVGYIERAWRGVLSAVKEVADKAKDLGRDKTGAEELAGLRKRLADREAAGPFHETRDLFDKTNAGLRERIALLDRLNAQQEQSAKARAENIARERAGIASVEAISKATDQYAPKQEKLNKALREYRDQLTALRALNSDDPNIKKLLDPAAIARTEAGIRDQFKERGGRGRAADPFASEREFAKAYADTFKDFDRIHDEAIAKTLDLSKGQARLLEYLKSPAYANHSEEMRQINLQKAYAVIATEQQVEAEKQWAKVAKEVADTVAEGQKVRLDAVRIAEQEAAAAEQQFQQYGLLKSQVQQLTLAKLEEARASAALAGEDVVDIERRIAAQKRLIAAQQGFEAKEVQKKAAEETRREWEKTADSINDSLTDALLRGFESGKDFASNFRDTLKNMFSTLVLRPMIQAMFGPSSGGMGGLGGMAQSMMGGGGMSGGMSPMNMVSAGQSLFTIGSQVFGGGSMLVGNGMGAFAPTAGGYAAAASASASSAAGAAGAASTAGTAGTFMGMGPVGWIALAAMSDYMMGQKAGLPKWATFVLPGIGPIARLLGVRPGERRNGGQYGYSFDGQAVLNARRGTSVSASGIGATFLEGPSGGPGQDDMAIINDTVTGINAALRALGSDARLNGFQAGYETSKKGRGGVFSGGSLSTGARFGESGQGDNYMGTLFESTSTQSPNEEEAWKNFTEDLKQSTLQALQAADVPGKLGEYLRSLGDVEKLTGSSLEREYARLNKIISERDALETQRFNMTHTALESALRAREKEREAIDEANRALYDHVSALSDLRAAEASARDNLLEAYDRESAALFGIIERHQGYAQSLREVRDGLSLTGLGRTQRTQSTAGSFDSTLTKAIGGDENALQALGEAGRSYVDALRDSVRNRVEFVTGIARVQAGLTTAAASSDGRASAAQRQLDAMTQQLSALGLLNTSILSVGEALGAFLSAQTAIAQEQLRYTAQIAAEQAAADQAAAVAAAAAAALVVSAPVGAATTSWQQFLQSIGGGGSDPLGVGPGHGSGAATGGWRSSGPLMVGELGPEVIDLETPGRVYTNEQTRGMFASNAELVPLLREVSSELRAQRNESKVADVATVSALKNIDARLKKFDTVGMPTVALP
jgi:phage-related minor tail protein